MTQRVDLRFNGQPVRVPRGVTLFDAASWNGIAIDSTCGGHGTCKKCRIRFRENPPVPTSLDLRAYTAQEIKDGWRLACRTPATGDADVEVPPLTTRPKAAMVGVGRQVILRPAVCKRYLELAEPSLADQVTDLERVLAALTDLEPAADLAVLRNPRPDAAAGRLQGDRGRRRRQADRGRARRHDAARLRPGLRPRHHHGRRHPARPDHRHPGGGAVDAQQAAAVRRRRDHPDQRDDARPGGARQAAAARPGRPSRSWRPPCARRAGFSRARSTRSRSRATPPWSTWSSASTPSRSASRRSSWPPGCCPRSGRGTSASPRTRERARWCSPRSARTSAVTSPPGCWPAGWTATRGSGCSSTSARTARSCSAAGTGCWRPPPRPGPRSRAPRSAAGCAPPTARSKR